MPEIQEAIQVDVEEGLHRHLAIMGEVRSLVGDRISPVNAAQNVILPRITYQLIGDQPVKHLKGETGQKVATFHLKAWANDPGKAKGIARAVAGRRAEPRLSGFRGLLGGVIRAAMVWVDDRASEVEIPMSGEDAGEYWHLSVVTVQYDDPMVSE